MLTFLNKYKTLIVIILSFLIANYYENISKTINEILNLSLRRSSEEIRKEKFFTKEELAKYNGKIYPDEIYLSILGSVYDVSKGKKHYGDGCTYNFFAGRDASVSFVTGDFETYTENSDDVLQLEASEILSLENWKNFYDKDYTYIGKLIGRFYDENGVNTNYYHKVDEQIALAKSKKLEEEKLQEKFPMCNIEWKTETGTKVWCTSSSGGKKRSWIGVPRKYFEPGKTEYRCACVREDLLDSPNLKTYDDCPLTADTCYYNV